MAIVAKDRKKQYEKDQNELFAMLDKCIDDMRSGRIGKPSCQGKQTIGYNM